MRRGNNSKEDLTANNLYDLSCKKALVTGCSPGIGEALAGELAGAGAEKIGVSGSLKQGGNAKTGVKAPEKNFSSYMIDLSNRKDLFKGIARIKEGNPVIDVLINNAEIIRRRMTVSNSDLDWNDVLNINLDAAFILARESGKDMVQRKSVKIIFACSLLSFLRGVTIRGYAASKDAIVNLVKALSNEWDVHHVNVNGIAAGYIASENTKSLRESQERNKIILGRILTGRWRTAGDFKGLVVFLKAAAANNIYGILFPVAGRWVER